jgi:hypothetical protein
MEEDQSRAGPPEGVAGLPSIAILVHRNVDDLIRVLDELPVIAERDGFWPAIRHAQTYVRLAIHSVWLQPSRNRIQERDRHTVLGLLERPWVDYLLLSDRRGEMARQDLLTAVIDLGVSRSIHHLAERARETPLYPLETPRRAAAVEER